MEVEEEEEEEKEGGGGGGGGRQPSRQGGHTTIITQVAADKQRLFRAFGTRNTHEFADVPHDVPPSIGRLSLSLPLPSTFPRPYLFPRRSLLLLSSPLLSLSPRWSIRDGGTPHHLSPSLSPVYSRAKVHPSRTAVSKKLSNRQISLARRLRDSFVVPSLDSRSERISRLGEERGESSDSLGRSGSPDSRRSAERAPLLRRIVPGAPRHGRVRRRTGYAVVAGSCPSIRRATNEDFK